MNHASNRKINSLQSWIVVLTSALFFFYIFIQMNMFNSIGSVLIQTYNISSLHLGNISAVYFYSTVIFLFPAGLLCDYFSIRRILLMTTAIAGIAAVMFGHAAHIWELFITRALIGVAGSFCLIGSVKLASRWFSPKRMALVLGLVVTLAMLGGMVAQTPFIWLMEIVGWRRAMDYNAILGGIIFILMLVFLRDYPENYNIKAEQASIKHQVKFWTAMKQVLKNTQNWFAGLYTSLINLPIILLGAIWGATYLVQVEKLSYSQATSVSSMLFLGSIIGCPLIGWLSDKVGLRKAPMIIGAVLCLMNFLAILYLPNLNIYSLLMLFLLLGIFTSVQVLGYPLLVESNPLMLTARAQGLASMLIMAGGFTQPLFGWLMSLHWDHKMVNNLPVYSKTDLLLAMSIISVAFIAALIIACCARETYCKNQEN
jgi:MFS family permease